MTDETEPKPPRKKGGSKPGSVYGAYDPDKFPKGSIPAAVKARKPKNKTKPARAALKLKRENIRKLDPDGLTPRERKFILLWSGTCDFNGTKAAREAGIAESSSSAWASTLLQKPHIIKALNNLLENRSRDLRIGNRTVLYEAWVCYTVAREKGDLSSAKAFLEIIGKHVDVQAFRTQLGIGNPDGSNIELDLSVYSKDEKLTLLGLLERGGAVGPDSVDRGPTSVN